MKARLLLVLFVLSAGLALLWTGIVAAQGGWVPSTTGGFGAPSNSGVIALAPFGGRLYAGTSNESGTGAQLWRSSEGVVWTPVLTNGFGITRNYGINHLFPFGGRLYAGTWADEVNGGEVYRSSDGVNWTRVVSRGFGDPTNAEVFRFAAFNNRLYPAP